jgi:uncharacterized protein (TIRG00374 family)
VEAAPAPVATGGARRLAVRGVLLLLTGISLYLLLPSLLEVFSSWRTLGRLEPAWIGVSVLFELLSFVALWELQRIALDTPSWFAVGTSQVVANAAGRLIPGGGAAAGAVQYRLLVRTGVPAASIAPGLAASFAATGAAVLALPPLALVTVLFQVGGLDAPKGLRQVAYVGAAAFVVVALLLAAALLWDRPLAAVGRAVRWALSHTRKRDAVSDLPAELLRRRDFLRRVFAAHPWLALLSSLGTRGFDYLVLICALAAVGARPSPGLVLLAYAGASLLGMIPITPGGLGFVEAGLTGMLALAGVSPGDAAVATLAYRLVSFWAPLPAGLVALWLFRRRYSAGAGAGTAATTASPP